MQVPGAEPLPTTFGAVSMSSEFGRTTILRPSPLHRMIDLADRVAIVTGATRGIGLATLIIAGITGRATRFRVSCSLSHPRSRGWQAERSRGDAFRPRTPRLPRPSGDSDSPSPPVDASRVADF